MTGQGDRYWAFWESLITEIKRVRPRLGQQLSPRKKAGIQLERSPRTGATYRLWWSGGSRTKRLRAEFFVRGNRELYRSLAEHHFEIEEAFGGPLAWEPMVGERDGRISAYHGFTYALRELPAAAALCPWILETLDRLKHATNPVLLGHPPLSLSGDEAGARTLDRQAAPEGAKTRVEVNRYERSGWARSACLEHYGPRCQVCGVDFEERYGELGRGYMHVHHVIPLHQVAKTPNYQVDPIADLRPVCPNCHAMLHRPKDRVLTVEELRELLSPERPNLG